MPASWFLPLFPVGTRGFDVSSLRRWTSSITWVGCRCNICYQQWWGLHQKVEVALKSIKRRDGPFMLASFSPHDKSGVFLRHHRFKKQLCNSFSFNDTSTQKLKDSQIIYEDMLKQYRKIRLSGKKLDFCSCTVPALMWRLFLIIQESTAAYSHTLSAGINATKPWWPCCLVANCVVSVNGW